MCRLKETKYWYVCESIIDNQSSLQQCEPLGYRGADRVSEQTPEFHASASEGRALGTEGYLVYKESHVHWLREVVGSPHTLQAADVRSPSSCLCSLCLSRILRT